MHNLPSKKTTGMQHRKEISYAARYSKCAYILSTFAGIWRPMWIFSCVLKKLFGNRRITMTSMGYDTVLQQSTSCWHRYGQRWKRLKRRRYWWGYSWLLCVALRCVVSGFIWSSAAACRYRSHFQQPPSASIFPFVRRQFSMTSSICRIYNIHISTRTCFSPHLSKLFVNRVVAAAVDVVIQLMLE